MAHLIIDFERLCSILSNDVCGNQIKCHFVHFIEENKEKSEMANQFTTSVQQPCMISLFPEEILADNGIFYRETYLSPTNKIKSICVSYNVLLNRPVY